MIVTAIFCGICAFCAGVCACTVLYAAISVSKSPTQQKPKPQRVQKMSEEQERELRRRQRELINFFNYNGEEMPDTEEGGTKCRRE